MEISQAGFQMDKRKKLIRNLTLIFLGIVVFLTFFSKTINNFLLPEVEWDISASGYLTKEITARGQVVPTNIETIYSNGAGPLTEVKVSEGDTVAKGDVLGTVDVHDIQLEIKRLELNLLKTENELKRYKNSFKPIDIEMYRNDMTSAYKAVEKAKKVLEEQKTLYESGAATLESVNTAEDQLDTALSDYEYKEKLLLSKEEENKKSLEDYRITVQEREAGIAVSKLELENLKKNLPVDGFIKSPIDGIVYSVPISGNSTVNKGQVLFQLIDNASDNYIRWELAGNSSDEVNVKDTVEFTGDATRKFHFYGTVQEKKYLANEGAYEYKADIDKADHKLEIGQTVYVSMKKSSELYKTIVQNRSVIKEGTNTFVFVLETRDGVMGKEDFVRKVEVKVLESDDLKSAISSSNLKEDARIVVFSTKALSDKIQVKLR